MEELNLKRFKICSKKDCEQNNPQTLNNFPFRNKKKNQLDSWCKFCRKNIRRNFYLKNKEVEDLRAKEWNFQNSEKVKNNRRKLYLKNKEKENEQSKKYWKDNREKLVEKERKRLETDLNFKLRKYLRNRIHDALLSESRKCGSAIRDLGCSVEELKIYIQSKFKDNMSWQNYGVNGWHIDHIKPLANFDLTNREQFLEACHYTNLQPLWWQENLSKGNRV